MVVEKILGRGERAAADLPASHGTTGYEWLNDITRLLVDDGGLARLDGVWPNSPATPRTFARC